MKLLVTGADGFVGRHLVRRLTQAGHSVGAACRPGGRQVEWGDGDVAPVPLELTDWAAQPQFGNTVALRMDHRIKAGQGVDGPPVALFETRLPLESKPVRSIALPDDERIEIYAMTLTAG